LAFFLLTQPVLSIEAEGIEHPAAQETDAGTPDPRFGVIEAFWEADEAAELNVGWDRILFYWNEIQPTGPDDWNTLHVLEEWLDDANEQERMVMGLLKNTPTWATDGAPFSGVPRGLYLPVDDPENLWAGYVRKVVEYYAPLGVHHWIIWNEPEIAAGTYGHEFAGSTQDYYQLLKVAYQVAKAGDPQAVIHLAGWSYWHDPGWLDDFLQVAVADPEGPANNYFFDIVTLHIYFRVETVEELVEETWAIQERYGIRKPIWINETNASPNLDPLWPVERPDFQVDLEQQAWYLVQAHALGFGANTARIGIYKLLDILLPPGGESFGILRPDSSRRPAFDAYQTTIRHLQGFTYPVGRQQERDFYSFTFKRPAGMTRILWARNSTDVTVQVPALADQALLVSATGEEQPIRALNGYYRLRLHGARCTPACDIGGPPVFLVEREVGNMKASEVATIDPSTVILATATATPLATAASAELTTPGSTTPTVENSPAGTPEATPSPTTTPEPTETSTPSPTPTSSPTAAATAFEPTSTVAPAAVAELDDLPPAAGSETSDSPPLQQPLPDARVGNGSVASWLFLGAAAVLAVMLAFIVARQRQS
jgi:hypothetical protein